VLDTIVLDRHAAPFRKRVSEKQGPYQMRTTAETYGLAWNEEKAHGAEYDAMASARVAWHMGTISHKPREQRPTWVHALRNSRGPYDRFDDLACDVDELHHRQTRWAATQAASFEEYLRKTDPTTVIPREWPLRPFPAAVTA
jgi:DNA polymerase-3 subunit epsilon